RQQVGVDRRGGESEVNGHFDDARTAAKPGQLAKACAAIAPTVRRQADASLSDAVGGVQRCGAGIAKYHIDLLLLPDVPAERASIVCCRQYVSVGAANGLAAEIPRAGNLQAQERCDHASHAGT